MRAVGFWCQGRCHDSRTGGITVHAPGPVIRVEGSQSPETAADKILEVLRKVGHTQSGDTMQGGFR
jgi:hypothetical protein